MWGANKKEEEKFAFPHCICFAIFLIVATRIIIFSFVLL